MKKKQQFGKHALVLLATGLLINANTYGQLSTNPTSSQTVTGAAQTPTQGRENRPSKSDKSSLIMQPIMHMLDQMKSAKKTGDPDMDYVTLIKIHHQAQLALAQQAVKNGQNTQVIDKAKALISEEEKAIADLNNITKNLRAGSSNSAFQQQTDQKLKALDIEVQKNNNNTMSGNFDQDYLNVLRQQYQNGFDLSQDYLQYGKHQELIGHAQRMVTQNKQEMESLKDLIK